MAQCPRCSGRLLYRHGEAWCISHGTIATERQPGDAVWSPSPTRDRVTAPRTGEPWTPAEWDYLMAHARDMSAAEIAAHLGRTASGIHKLLAKRRVSKPHPHRVPVAVQLPSEPAPKWRRWTQAEDEWLQDNIGRGLLQLVSSRLNRSPEAVRMRLRILGQRRAVDGYMTAHDVARQYRCPRYRVWLLIRQGALPTHRLPGVRYLRIDPADCEAIRDQLTAPKRTYRYCPPDTGDWYKRYK